MNNKIKYEYVKRFWELRGGVVYSKRTGNPISFACKNKMGHRFVVVKVNNKPHAIYVYEAAFALYHNRPIAEDKEIHHKDGNPENNAPENIVELTRTQHKRIHGYQIDDPLRGISLYKGAWRFQWCDDYGIRRDRRFHGINEAMTFRAEIEEPRRQELRALGLNCRKISRGVTSSQLRKISRKQNNRLWRTHI
ncbi:TPA: HNH endonuclease [Escherichia coli]|nr:HNH endonuclease [Escherichia coli]HBB9455428.1 HNH endonuclease [Escherichia coli]